MTIAIMQPYLFPYIGYWQLINAVDTFVIYDGVNFIKKGYINKNAILVNGKSQAFTLELLKASQNKLINEIEIGNNRQKLLKTIVMAYKKAPFFDITYFLIEDILMQEETNLAKYLGYSLKKISESLELNTDFIYSSHVNKNNSLKSQDKILEISKQLGAKNYINAIGGKELYEKNAFQNENIKLNFIKTKFMKYNQYKNEFVGNLSIIDVMMFNDVDVIRNMLEGYEFV